MFLQGLWSQQFFADAYNEFGELKTLPLRIGIWPGRNNFMCLGFKSFEQIFAKVTA